MNIFLFIVEIIFIVVSFYCAYTEFYDGAIIIALMAIYLRLLNEEHFP